MWFAGGYPDRQSVENALAGWKAPALVVAQDLFPTALTAAATYILPAISSFEKEGTFVNHAGLAQSFTRSIRPPQEARSELQLGFDLLGRKGLAQAATIRAELAAKISAFASLAEKTVPVNGVRFELAMA
jgi:NADH-quinone oxidoreductase subunit G